MGELARVPVRTLAMRSTADWRWPKQATWRRVSRIGLWFVPVGVLLVALGQMLAPTGSPWAIVLYWTGLAVVFTPAAAALWSGTTRRWEHIAVLVVASLALYAVKVLGNPGMFNGYDELLHYRTLDDVIQTGRLFGHNPLLPISPGYPGLEIVTHAVVSVTGLPAFASGLLVVAVARVLMVVSLYLLLERVSVPPRSAAVGALVYLASPSFLAFDAQFAYESLALPLALFCLFVLRHAQGETGRTKLLLDVVGAVAMLAVVVTHHVTSFILAAVLVVWTLATLVFGRPRGERLPGGGWVAPLAVAAIVLWLTVVAKSTLSYLAPQLMGAMREALRIVGGQAEGRRLFQSAGGETSPLFDRVIGISSVLLLVAALPFGVRYVWRRQRGQVLPVLLVLAAALYPLLLLMRFSSGGWEIGSRPMAWVYVSLGFTVAAALELLRRRLARSAWLPLAAVSALVVVFLGGVVAGTSPLDRLPQRYHPASDQASIDTQGMAAADWASMRLGPGNRFAADTTNASLMGSYGRQRMVTSDDELSVSPLFVAPFGGYQRDLLRRGGIQYLVVDMRLAGVSPPSGFLYEKWERQLFDYGPVLSAKTLGQYDDMPQASRVFDSGGIRVYDVRRLAR